MEARIRSFGMCTPERQVLSETDFVLFGASELVMEGLRFRTSSMEPYSPATARARWSSPTRPWSRGLAGGCRGS